MTWRRRHANARGRARRHRLPAEAVQRSGAAERDCQGPGRATL